MVDEKLHMSVFKIIFKCPLHRACYQITYAININQTIVFQILNYS